MADEQPQNTNLASTEGISKLVERIGLPTVALGIVAYVIWNSVLSPMAERYNEMLAGVTSSNAQLSDVIDELKDGIIRIGESNQLKMDKLSDDVGENADLLKSIDSKLSALTEVSKDIDRKLERLPRLGSAEE